MSSIEKAQSPALFGPLLALLLSTLVTMFLLSQLLLPESSDKRLLALAKQANALFCGAISSNSLCPRVEAVTALPPAHPVPPARPNDTVFGALQWRGGSEAEAAAFVATVKTLGMQHTERRSRYAQEETTAIIGPVFRDYPALVSASACIYCGDISEAILTNIAQQEISPEWALEVGRGISRYLPLLAERHALDSTELQRLALIQAQLGTAGTGQLAKFVVQNLIDLGEMRLLRLWVGKGLNGGQGFRDEAQLAQLPREVVIAAWRHNVALANAAPLLTEYLLKSGYRPALRWLVWLQDGGATRLVDKYSSYQFHRHDYQRMLASHTDFPLHSGPGLGEFYSEHWQSIVWDENVKKWRF